jgi:hypothetical protein
MRTHRAQEISALEAFQREESNRVAKTKLETVDLLKFTSRSNICRTTVTVHLDWETKVKWLVFGEAQIQKFGKKHQYLLKAYLPAGVTDFEHDSAYAFRLPLVGLELDDILISYGNTFLVAYVADEPEDFRIPRPDYNPLKGAEKCTLKECGKPHLIVPEGNYAGPQFDREIFELVRGKLVEIVVGPAPTKDDVEE